MHIDEVAAESMLPKEGKRTKITIDKARKSGIAYFVDNLALALALAIAIFLPSLPFLLGTYRRPLTIDTYSEILQPLPGPAEKVTIKL